MPDYFNSLLICRGFRELSAGLAQIDRAAAPGVGFAPVERLRRAFPGAQLAGRAGGGGSYRQLMDEINEFISFKKGPSPAPCSAAIRPLQTSLHT